MPLFIEDKTSIDAKDKCLNYLNLALGMQKEFMANIKFDPDLKNLRKEFKTEYKKLVNEV